MLSRITSGLARWRTLGIQIPIFMRASATDWGIVASRLVVVEQGRPGPAPWPIGTPAATAATPLARQVAAAPVPPLRAWRLLLSGTAGAAMLRLGPVWEAALRPSSEALGRGTVGVPGPRVRRPPTPRRRSRRPAGSGRRLRSAGRRRQRRAWH